MEKCFIIQPFDKDKFDRRFVDVFKPAIIAAGLEAYRVDQDLSVRIPIQDIENQIQKARICFAEISTDNPNVWYELGYAFASGKDVVMVCSDERVTKFPFDIQHRKIIKYETQSSSDFTNLAEEITKQTGAYLRTSQKAEEMIANPVKENKGLASHEIALLIFALESSLSKEDISSLDNLQSDMERAGYTKAAANIAIRQLEKKDMITTFSVESGFNEGYFGCRLTDKGESWLMNNQDKIEFRKPPTQQNKETISIEDIPF